MIIKRKRVEILIKDTIADNKREGAFVSLFQNPRLIDNDNEEETRIDVPKNKTTTVSG